jgi:hypothetical protein
MGGTVDSSVWRKVHNLWISEVYTALKPQVAGRLSLAIDQEITLLDHDVPVERMRPDIHTVAHGTHPAPSTNPSGGAPRAVEYAEGVEAWSTESRHFTIQRDLGGGQVIGVFEILSPTNKGCFNRLDLEAFAHRRQRLLQSGVSYLQVDAVAQGTRWLPRSLEQLSRHAGIAWTSTAEGTQRR